MQKLVKGIHHFQANIFRSNQDLFRRLAEGQVPDALFITCSDSRINPNLITQTDPGDLFILRNAGNIIPAYGSARGGEEATIEFAVAGLGIQDIILCGHSHCGAMKGLLDPKMTKNLPATERWLHHAESTRRIIHDNYKQLEGPQLLTATVEVNVLVQLENLRTHPTVASGLARGELKLHGWVYKIETGEVFAYDPVQAQFVSVSETPPGPVPSPARLTPAHGI